MEHAHTMHISDILQRLKNDPPQVLLLEGGSTDERIEAARFWAKLNNCESGSACGHCPACIQVEEGAHADVITLDGREGKIKIDTIRELKPLFGQSPRGDGKRVVIFIEAQELLVPSANALLKTLEEPCPGTLFVLLAPHRERLLPTLVSRSWVLTLPWPHHPPLSEETLEWLKSFEAFLQTGKGWFKKSSAKGAMNKDIALQIIQGCRRELALVLSGQDAGSLGRLLAARLDLARLKKFDLSLGYAEDALNLPTAVNPNLVIDWLATHCFDLMHR